MAKQSAINLDITLNNDGFDVAGGAVSKRKLTLSGSDVAFIGTGNFQYTLPSATGTLASLLGTETFTNKTLGASTSVSSSISWASGVKQTFAPNTTTAGLNFGSFAGDPSVPVAGDVWYNSTTNKFVMRDNANSFNIGNVTGPASSTHNAVARFSASSGQIIKNGVLTVDDSGNLSGGNLTSSGYLYGTDIYVETYNASASSASSIVFRRSRGNSGSPLVVQSGDTIGYAIWQGQRTTVPGERGSAAYIFATSTETWSTGAWGSTISITATPNGSVDSFAKGIRIDPTNSSLEPYQDAGMSLGRASFKFVNAHLSGDITLYQKTAPGTPATDTLVIYCKDKAGTPALYYKNDAGVEAELGLASGGGITSLNGLTAGTQTFSTANDTNVTLAISSVTSTHTYTMGWTGTLAKARQHAATVYTDAGNSWTTGAQSFAAATSLQVPTSAGAAPTSSGHIAYDSTANAWEFGVNGANRVVTLGGSLTLAAAFITSGANSLTLTTSAATNVTLPTTGTLATLAGSETLTNKTFNLTSNTFSGTTAQFNTALSDNDFATLAGSETLTNKTLNLTSNTLSGTIAQFNTSLSDADFATLAGSETLSNKTLTAPRFATAGLIADANGNELILFPATVASAVNEITVSNAATAGTPSIAATGGDPNISLNLVSKGTGVVQANGVALDTISGTATLTNKTLNLTSNTLSGTTAQFNTALSDNDFATLAGSETLTNKTLNLTSNTLSGTTAQFNTALSDADFATLAGSETLTNKTFNLTSNTFSGTTAQFNTALSDNDFATLAGSETLSNKTLTAPRFATAGFIADANGNELILFPTTVASAVNEITVSNAIATGTPSIAATGGDTNINLNIVTKGTGVLQLNGVTVDTISSTATLTNKTINLTSNTLSGTTAQFNTALSDNDFATLAGSETLTNKTLTAPRFASAGFIADANGNELIDFPATVSSAINEILITNSAAGSRTTGPSVSVAGGDTNTSLILDAKGTGVVIAKQAIVPEIVVLTDAATIATDASLGNRFRVTLGANVARTLGAPTNPTDGQQCTWEIIQNGTTASTLALASGAGGFAFGTDITSITITSTLSKTDYITAIYNSTADRWRVAGFVKGY